MAVAAIAVAIIGGAIDSPDLDAQAPHHRPARAADQSTARSAADQSTARSAALPKTVLTVGAPQKVHPIRAGFLGLSLEFSTVEAYAGTDPANPNPVFLQLIRNISPRQRPAIRIGGDSTDWAWWPTASVKRPAGIRITLTPRWLAVTHALATTLNAKMMLGINLEADNPKLAGAEARAFVKGIGHVQALEVGNEPELYHSFGWYTDRRGNAVPGRPANWSFERYLADYANISHSLPRVTLAGPAIGSPGWLSQVGRFAAAQRGRARIVTVHRYPLGGCGAPAASNETPSVARMLAPASSAGLADSTAGLVAAAHAHGSSIRVDEMNTVSCGGAKGVSDVFASALWTVDTLFSMARVGVDGVNFHTFRGATYGLFSFKHSRGVWSAFVKPQYYGMLLFAQAAPAGARLLSVSGADSSLRAWATRAPDGRTRVVLINDGARRPRSVGVRAGGARGAAWVQRLVGRSLGATGAARLGGQSFGPRTTTGRLGGTPRITSIGPRRNVYNVSLPPASAAMLTLG